MNKNGCMKGIALTIIFFIVAASFTTLSVGTNIDNKPISNIPTEQRLTIRDIFFDLKMSLYMKLAKIPSLSTCIIENDEVIWSNQYGFYDLENKKPANHNTIYNVA